MLENSQSVNIFKYIDYADPIIYQKSDYRTSNGRAHRFTKNHVLCDELKRSWSDYKPRSESSKKFSWKINSSRDYHDRLAPSLSSVRYLHQLTNKVKSPGVIIPMSQYNSRTPPLTELPREPKRAIVEQPRIEHIWRETHFTDTAGYFPLADKLLSTTELDFHPHANYATARTNLIVRKELRSTLTSLSSSPTRSSSRKNLRDVAKFTQPSFDRIIPNRSCFVKNFGLTTEMTSNY